MPKPVTESDTLITCAKAITAKNMPNPTQKGTAISRATYRSSAVIRRAGVECDRPRVHDIRHTFAVHRLTQWYREGVDAQARLPYLAAYMGHKGVSSTLTYITMTPELLRQFSSRFHAVATRLGLAERDEHDPHA